MNRRASSLVVALSLFALPAMAQDSVDRSVRSVTAPVSSSPFDKGSKEVQLALGFFVSQNYHDIFRPQMNDIDLTARYGWMLYDPCGPSIIRGNLEVLAEIFAGGFVKGPADVIAGATLFLRYNYVQPDARFVPYVQIGGGGAYSDASEDQVQRLLGSEVSFNLQVGFGARYLCTEKLGVFLEFDYRHISNASLAERNYGFNSYGSWLGASFFF